MKNISAFTLNIFLLLTISIITVDKVSAQENGIFEIKNNNKILSKTNAKKSSDRKEFYKLSQKLHTTAYISNNSVRNTYGDGKVQKITFSDSKSFSLLNNNDYNEVELITITLKNSSDLNNKLDLTSNKNLGKLKYVFIKCYFKCTENQIEDFITSDSNIRVFYRTETPS